MGLSDKILQVIYKPVVYMAFTTVFMMLCISCNNRRFTKQLDIADSLAAVNTPKTIEILERIKDSVDASCEEDNMRWKLIRVKADVYSFKKFSSDSLIHPVVEYYERHDNDKKKLTEAYYYAGKVYYSTNDIPRAIDYYLKVLNIIPEDEVNLKARTYNQLGYIYASQWLGENSLKMFLKADSCYLVSGDTASCIYTQRDIACAYFDKKEKDSAYYYIDRAIKLAKELNNKDLEIDVYSQKANMYSLEEKYTQAKKLIKYALDYNGYYNKNSVFSIAARTYMGLGHTDSAFTYYNKLISYGNIRTKQQAHRELAKYFINNNNPQNALHHLEQYRIYTDSVNFITSTEVVMQKNNQYNYSLREKENIRLKQENNNKTIAIIILSSFVLITIIIIIFITIFIRIKKKFKLDKYSLLIEKVSEISGLTQHIQTKMEDSRIWLRIKQIINNPNEKKKLTDDEWQELDKTINILYPNFNKKLADLCKMNINDYRLCLLLKTGLSLSNIGDFMNLSSSGVNSVRRKLYKRAFGTVTSVKDWDDIISSL